jgi:hypothetical protein
MYLMEEIQTLYIVLAFLVKSQDQLGWLMPWDRKKNIFKAEIHVTSYLHVK